MIRGIKLASIPVRNQDASLKFYTEKLGFKVATDQPFNEKQRWIELQISGADTRFVLFTPDGHEGRIGGFQPMTFWCDDVFATSSQLKAKGVEFAVGPEERSLGHDGDLQRRRRQSVRAVEPVSRLIVRTSPSA